MLENGLTGALISLSVYRPLHKRKCSYQCNEVFKGEVCRYYHWSKKVAVALLLSLKVNIQYRIFSIVFVLHGAS